MMEDELPINGRYNPYNPNITKQLREEYIQFFNDVVCPDAKEWINPFDGYFSIPTWREMVSIRNEINDDTSELTKHLKNKGLLEQYKKNLKVITFEEYIKSKQ